MLPKTMIQKLKCQLNEILRIYRKTNGKKHNKYRIIFKNDHLHDLLSDIIGNHAK